VAHLGHFADGLALVWLQRRIRHLENFHAMPFAGE